MADNVSGSRGEHERGLALFIVPSRRDRFRDSLRNPRRRRKLRAELYHFEDRLDERYARELEQHTMHEQHVEQVHALLLDGGAPATCCVLSADGDDGDAIALRCAVAQLMTQGAGFISCIPGRLGLHVREDGSDVFLLTRDSSPRAELLPRAKTRTLPRTRRECRICLITAPGTRRHRGPMLTLADRARRGAVICGVPPAYWRVAPARVASLVTTGHLTRHMSTRRPV